MKIWLPLNGNIDNQGLSNATVTNSGVTFDNSGKIGKCAYFNGSAYLLGSNAPLNNDTVDFTVVCWLKVTSSHAGCIYSNRTSSSRNGITVFWSSGNFVFDDGTRWDFTPSTTIANNVWYHLVFVRKKGVGKYLYINGVLSNSTTTTGTLTAANPTHFAIGGSQSSSTTINNNPLNGYLNDFRVYDYALSPREIELLSRGMVCHYPLNDNGIGVPNLVDNSYDFTGWSAGDGWTKGISDDGTPMYSFSRTGSTGNTWVRLIPPLKIDANNYPDGVTVSMDVYTPSKSNMTSSRFGSLQVYDASGSRIGWYEPQWQTSLLQDNKWVRLSYHFSQSALLTNSRGGTYSYTQFSFQLERDGNISIRKIKIESGTIATPYTLSLNDINDTTEYDVSGYNYNGTKVGTLDYSSDTPRYSVCTVFNGTDATIDCGYAFHIQGAQNMSMACWGYCNDWTTSNHKYLLSSQQTGGLVLSYMSGTTMRARWHVYTAEDLSTYAYSSADFAVSLTSGWHYFCGTLDDSSIKLYIDGVRVKDHSITNYGVHFNNTASMFIGGESAGNHATDFFNGKISDVRIYYTTLTDAQVADLYNTTASIANNGSMLGYELVEV